MRWRTRNDMRLLLGLWVFLFTFLSCIDSIVLTNYKRIHDVFESNSCRKSVNRLTKTLFHTHRHFSDRFDATLRLTIKRLRQITYAYTQSIAPFHTHTHTHDKTWTFRQRSKPLNWTKTKMKMKMKIHTLRKPFHAIDSKEVIKILDIFRSHAFWSLSTVIKPIENHNQLCITWM